MTSKMSGVTVECSSCCFSIPLGKRCDVVQRFLYSSLRLFILECQGLYLLSQDVHRQLDGIVPVLASWNKNSDPEQQKLQQYLKHLREDLGPLPADERGLFLHMDIAVRPEAYTHHHDLDNYLYPVISCLKAPNFVFVSGTKHVEGTSRLVIGRAEPVGVLEESQGWTHATIDSPVMSAQNTAWKVGVRERLLALGPSRLAVGPVEMHLTWRYMAHLNWADLWKPPIDAMGPVLGEPRSDHPFDPDDGRIVSLGLHLTRDAEAWLGMPIGMHWRLAHV